MFLGASSSLSRVNNYRSKIRQYSGTGAQPDYTPPVVQFKLDEMYRKQAMVADEQANYQIRVKQTCGAAAVPIIMTGAYMAFAGQMYSICRRYTEEQRAVEAAALIALWVARGLSQVVLQGIRTDIFNVGAPLP